jgi:acyl dehydratase
MNVIQKIKEKKENIQHNNAELIARLEPKFRNLTNLINHKIANTLNNPWVSRFNGIDANSEEDNEAEDQVVSLAAESTYRSLMEQLDQETFLGNWFTVDQHCINQFAEVTHDTQWIHTDPQRAQQDSPFKSTIAHGFLTLSLIPALTETVDSERNPYPEAKMVVNYGLNKVRFPYPVKSGSRIRASIRLVEVTPMKRSLEVVNEVSIEVENRSRPACIAETVLRLYF